MFIPNTLDCQINTSGSITQSTKWFTCYVNSRGIGTINTNSNFTGFMFPHIYSSE